MELSVIIPSYGFNALLRTCLALLDEAIRHTGIEEFNVVAVDNGSAVPYRTSEFECRHLEVVRLDRRSSFSRACNVGAAKRPARLLLFLNNDVLLHRLALKDMLALAADAMVGVCGARLVYPDDRIQHCGIRFFGSGHGPHHEFHGWPTTSVSRSVRTFQAVTGAALLVRGDAFRSLGGFDETYPFGFEDTDLCLKIRQLGLTVICSQSVDSIHFESTTNKLPYRHMPSREIFFQRWYGRVVLDGDAAKMSQAVEISLIVHTRNSAAKLPPLLATTSWISDRILIDMSSTDETQALAATAGCRVVTIPPSEDVDAIRNNHLAQAREEWVLVLDSDESLSADAQTEISRLVAESGRTHDAFAIPRFNMIAGHIMRASGWYPDHQIRLFRRGTVAWSPGHHRPPRILTGYNRLLRLDPPDCMHIHHANYDSLADFVERQTRYLLTDRYDHAFDFNDYVAAAQQEMAKRHDVKADGDLSTALALLMAWDRIVRGILHWEKCGRAMPLESSLAVPFVVEVAPTTLQTLLGRAYRAMRTFYRHPLKLPKTLVREKLRRRRSRV